MLRLTNLSIEIWSTHLFLLFFAQISSVLTSGGMTNQPTLKAAQNRTFRAPPAMIEGPLLTISDLVFSTIILIYVLGLFVLMYFCFCWKKDFGKKDMHQPLIVVEEGEDTARRRAEKKPRRKSGECLQPYLTENKNKSARDLYIINGVSVDNERKANGDIHFKTIGADLENLVANRTVENENEEDKRIGMGGNSPSPDIYWN